MIKSDEVQKKINFLMTKVHLFGGGGKFIETLQELESLKKQTMRKEYIGELLEEKLRGEKYFWINDHYLLLMNPRPISINELRNGNIKWYQKREE